MVRYSRRLMPPNTPSFRVAQYWLQVALLGQKWAHLLVLAPCQDFISNQGSTFCLA